MVKHEESVNGNRSDALKFRTYARIIDAACFVRCYFSSRTITNGLVYHFMSSCYSNLHLQSGRLPPKKLKPHKT